VSQTQRTMIIDIRCEPKPNASKVSMSHNPYQQNPTQTMLSSLTPKTEVSCRQRQGQVGYYEGRGRYEYPFSGSTTTDVVG
jgi:hypothetical protein